MFLLGFCKKLDKRLLYQGYRLAQHIEKKITYIVEKIVEYARPCYIF